MKTIDNAEWVGYRRSSEVSQRYDQIAAAPIGQTFVIEKGVDFPIDEDPSAVRLRYVGSLRWRGIRVRTALRDGDLYIKIAGHFEDRDGSNGAGT